MMKKLILCACTTRSIIKRDELLKVAVSAKKAGWEIKMVADLCELCEDKKIPACKDSENCTFVACHPRAIKALMDFKGMYYCKAISLRDASADDVLKQLDIQAVEDDELKDMFTEQIESFEVKQGTDAWYPVIDKSRCLECGKCYDFCPFGVYEMSEDVVRVVNPNQCKNSCPSCARMCPHGAIIFPKYDHSPINGGTTQDEVTGTADAKTLYGDAFRQRLAERQASVSMLKK